MPGQVDGGLFVNGEDVPHHELGHFTAGHFAAQDPIVDVVRDVFPPYAELGVMLVMEGLQDTHGLTVGQSHGSFIGGSVNVLHRPDQSHPRSPIPLQDY